jgi:hypothetical protein
MRAKDFEADRIQIGSKKGARFIACRGPKHREKSLLRQLFRLAGIGDAPSEKSI